VKVGLYVEPARGGITGGAECCAAVLAEALRDRHHVEILHHAPALTAEELVELFGVDLRGVTVRYVPREPAPAGESRNPWRRYREASAWHADLSASHDLFVNFTHGMPPFCHARTGVLVVLFPLYDSPRCWGRDGAPPAGPSRLLRRLFRFYHAFEWRRRLRSYRLKTAISEFSRYWTRELWGSDCAVLSPPVDCDFRVAAKENALLSVGRFTPLKKQLVLLKAYSQLREEGVRDWAYWCAGGPGGAPEENAYFAQAQEAARACQAQICAGPPRAELRGLFERAKVFWHAMGYGEDDRKDPARMEHFGIVTVEAMAAGCVPVVVKKGAQPELVRHGVDGFLWDTPEELKEYTTLLARDDALRARMAEAARARALPFRRAGFVQRFRDLVGSALAAG
jgi:glycosyltransferase involved in cell wall biosynthesis